ncbi:something about silencing protein 10 [Blastocladiella emersonii ATCC 22665]|nr:something about silencing protein 10 [Blastocladiella emersonii ATCC 22665]
MARGRKGTSSNRGKPAAPAPVDEDKKFFVKASERDAIFGLGNDSDDDGENIFAGEDRVGTVDVEEDEVFGLDVPSDSEASDAERDFVPEDDDEATAQSGWGRRRGAFYNADDTFADDDAAKLEEEEALRLRREKLAKLKEEDFLDGAFAKIAGDSDLASLSRGPASGSTAAVVDGDSGKAEVEIVERRARSDMTRDEILEHLATTSPDLLEFILEYQSKMEDVRDGLAPMYAFAVRMEPETSPVRAYLAAKYFSVLGFLINVSYYLSRYAQATPRREIMVHPVVDVLVQFKRHMAAIEKIEEEKPWLAERLEPIVQAVEDMDELEMDVDEYVAYLQKELERERKEEEEEKLAEREAAGSDYDSEEEAEDDMDAANEEQLETVSRKRKRSDAASADSDDEAALATSDPALAGLSAKKRKRAAKLVASIQYEDDYKKVKSSSSSKKAKSATRAAGGDDFDETAADANLGAPAALSTLGLAKKPLRKIVQSVQAQGKAKKAISADSDVAKKAKRADTLNAHLSKEEMAAADRDADVFSDDDEAGAAGKTKKGGKQQSTEPQLNEVGINMAKVDPLRPITSLLEHKAKKDAKKIQKKVAKLVAREGLSREEAKQRVVQFNDEDDFDMNDMSSGAAAGKREASYKILKNKGLTPKRKKEDRNPRVKHRRKYEGKMKKLKSTKRLVTTLQGGYQGELTGIKTHLTRQINLN